ncbi:MAG: aspartate aminotransferase family protein [Deltaproteobacteria bacterium]|uniref:Acetylornithine aminotransferase n=1 Tax=Candidatus Zymogenus saltonus TaxID=2844893 RepID=A0A9D8KEG3_9DELT|nr:aspartate aminotransferase family protein [Candidatus Zymogenus saltonus]
MLKDEAKRNSESSLKYDYGHLMNTYSPAPIEMERGEGPYLWDVEGERYLDFVAGIAVMNLGHSHPKVVEAVKEQAERLVHVSNLYRIPRQAVVADLICDSSFGAKCFFANSGAEAIEAAIKLARRFGIREKGEDAIEIITADGSFHGRTMGAMAATAQTKIQKGFGPMTPGFNYVPYGNLQALEEAITENSAAVILEPIQGEGGVVVPPDYYLAGVREITNCENILMILDEIQTGMGRTGTLFAYEAFGIEPDAMVLAKGLAGGFPMGALVVGKKGADLFSPGDHASTFGGNPFVSAAAEAVITTTLEERILENCREVGDYFMKKLGGLADKFDFVKEVRGKGLLIGMELELADKETAVAIVDEMREKKILINLVQGRVLRFTPPLIIEKSHVDEVVTALDDVLSKIA